MRKFDAIEGLRAWLASAVVLSHCVLTSELEHTGWIFKQASKIGTIAVMMFIIISGFVITHLVMTKGETYSAYITRRFFRIFPLFSVACLIGFFTLPMLGDAMHLAPWSSHAANRPDEIVTSQIAFLWEHVVAHLTMLHGAVGNQILPESQYAFSPPAWSVSLEWQFYLVAPLILAAATRSTWAIVSIVLMAFGFYLYQRGYLGSFRNPSSLPGAGPFFMIGIASRSIMSRVSTASPLAWSVGAAALIPLTGETFIPILLWVCFFAFLSADRDQLTQIDRQALRLYGAAFTSRVALYWGARSYSAYLAHFSVLAVVAFFTLTLDQHLSQRLFLLSIIVLVFPATAAISILSYKYIEQPFMSIGTKIAAVAARKLVTSSGTAPASPRRIEPIDYGAR